MDKVTKLYRVVEENNMSATEVIDIFLNYFGTQLVGDEFFEFIEDEGYYVED